MPSLIESRILSHKNILNMLKDPCKARHRKEKKTPKKFVEFGLQSCAFVPFGNFFPRSHDCDKSYQ